MQVGNSKGQSTFTTTRFTGQTNGFAWINIQINFINGTGIATDRIIGMSNGYVVFDGKPNELKDDHLKTIYGGEDWLS
jgi:ABC-type enterochelin transport system ATPase subunit